MKVASMIYFVSMRFDRQVHAQALGFTFTYDEFSMADDAETARQQCCEYFEKRYGLKVVKSSVTPAPNQDLNRYVFKEQIVGSPEYLVREQQRARKGTRGGIRCA